MKWITPSFLAHWSRIEISHFGRGKPPLASGADERAHDAMFRGHDYRRLETLLITEKVHPLLKLRGLLFRGLLTEAQKPLKALESADENALPEARIELLIETCRLVGFRGDWKGMADTASEALGLDPQPMSRMALHQLRSLARYELQEFHGALEDLDRVDALALCFPHSNLPLYAAATRVRILARDRGPDAARALLDLAWKQVEARPDVDGVLTLLRTEADLARIAGKDDFEAAFGALLIAEAMGDLICRDLCLLELALGCNEDIRTGLLRELERRSAENGRLGLLLAELKSEPMTSTSFGLSRPRTRKPRTALPEVSRFSIIAIERFTLRVDLKKLEARSMPEAARYFRAFAVLDNSCAKKAEFFKSYWKISRYSRELHDGTVRTLLSRARKSLGVEILAEADQIEAPSVWTVADV